MAEKPWKKVMEEMHSSGSPVISRVSFKCGPGITYLTRDLGRNGKDILSLAVHTGACYVDSNDVVFSILKGCWSSGVPFPLTHTSSNLLM